jgi:hypothetical protein
MENRLPKIDGYPRAGMGGSALLVAFGEQSFLLLLDAGNATQCWLAHELAWIAFRN